MSGYTPEEIRNFDTLLNLTANDGVLQLQNEEEEEPIEASRPFMNITTQRGTQSGKAGIITGHAKGIVNAPPSEISAWCWDYCSKERVDLNKKSDLTREIVSHDSDHGMTIFHQKWFPSPLVTRDFLFRQVWKRLDQYTQCIIMYDDYSSFFNESFYRDRKSKDTVRGSIESVLVLQVSRRAATGDWRAGGSRAGCFV